MWWSCFHLFSFSALHQANWLLTLDCSSLIITVEFTNTLYMCGSILWFGNFIFIVKFILWNVKAFLLASMSFVWFHRNKKYSVRGLHRQEVDGRKGHFLFLQNVSSPKLNSFQWWPTSYYYDSSIIFIKWASLSQFIVKQRRGQKKQ